MAAVNMETLLEKMSNWDKDERYMATNDLCTNLQREELKMDKILENRIVVAVLKQLDDLNNDVQSVAVKCLAVMLKKVAVDQIQAICDKLCDLILDKDKDSLRDIYSIGLKTLIADVPNEMGATVAARLTNRLLSGIQGSTATEDIKRECLDNMSELFKRFGHLCMPRDHEQVMEQVVLQLHNERMVIRKRAANCLGALAVVSSDALLNNLVERVLSLIESADGAGGKSSGEAMSDTRTLIQTIGTISRTVGYRLGRHLDRLIPLFLRFCGDPSDESQQTAAADELREHCFPGLESFVLRCPREVSPHLEAILTCTTQFMKYDPNYSYDEDEGGEPMDHDDEDEEGGGDEDEDYGGSDDDDTSWKVRKAAVKVISAVISARPEMLNRLYDEKELGVADQLISRFKEREENVRLDILLCFSNLLQATLSSSSSRSSSASKQSSEAVSGGGGGGVSLDAFTSHPTLTRQKSTVHFLVEQMDKIISAARKQLQGSAVKTKSTVFSMLRTLVNVLNGGLTNYLPQLLGDVDKCMRTEKSQTLKLDCLLFLRLVYEKHAPADLQPSIDRLLPLVISAVNEDWYKIIAEALRVLGTIITVSRPRVDDMFVGDYSYAHIVQPIYSALMPRLEALDIDQEIKECAILTVGKLFAHLGDELSDKIDGVLALLMRRLDNEITRTPTLKTLGVIACSPLQLDLSSVLLQSSRQIAHFLRQQSRTLKQTTLATLDSLINSPSSQMSDELVQTLLGEACPLISDADLHIAHLALRMTSSLYNKYPPAAAPIQTLIYPKTIDLAGSSLLQGSAHTSLIELFQELVVNAPAGMTFADIFEALYNRVSLPLPPSSSQGSSSSSSSSSSQSGKQSFSNLAQCIAGICIKVPVQVRDATVARLAGDLADTEQETRRHLALLCIGELGQQADLSSNASLKDLILACFNSASEDTKTAAAYSLGHIAVGNMAVYLPVILEEVQKAQHQYLLMASLKWIIVLHANQPEKIEAFQGYLPQILPGLLKHCKAEEEGVRNLVAECLGLATFMNASAMIPTLQQLAQDESEHAHARWTIITALRFALSRPANMATASAILPALDGFFVSLTDEDLDVRRAALMMLNTAIFHNGELVKGFMQGINRELITTLAFEQERIVDLGPFKHKIDDGLPLRKAALTCVETTLDVMSDRLNIGELMPGIVSTLGNENTKPQAYQILIKICSIAPGAVLGISDSLIAPFDATIFPKKKAAASEKAAGGGGGGGGEGAQAGGEAERMQDIVKGALRVVAAVCKIEDIGNSTKWNDFVDKIKKSASVSEVFASFAAEKSEAQ